MSITIEDSLDIGKNMLHCAVPWDSTAVVLWHQTVTTSLGLKFPKWQCV